jgi:hypothetical protein
MAEVAGGRAGWLTGVRSSFHASAGAAISYRGVMLLADPLVVLKLR